LDAAVAKLLWPVVLLTDEYEINVLWNVSKVAGCPVIGRAVALTPPLRKSRPIPPPVQNRDKIILTGQGLTSARVNRQAEFVIDATGASPGKILFFIEHGVWSTLSPVQF